MKVKVPSNHPKIAQWADAHASACEMLIIIVRFPRFRAELRAEDAKQSEGTQTP